MNPTLVIAVHWLHLTAAIAAIGGTIFLRMVVQPALASLEGEAREAFERGIRRKVKMLVLHSVMLLILTGFFNFVRVFQEGRPPIYTAIFLAKFLLAMVVIGIALGLTLTSGSLERFQAHRSRWLLLNIFLGLIVVFLSAWLRMIPHA